MLQFASIQHMNGVSIIEKSCRIVPSEKDSWSRGAALWWCNAAFHLASYSSVICDRGTHWLGQISTLLFYSRHRQRYAQWMKHSSLFLGLMCLLELCRSCPLLCAAVTHFNIFNYAGPFLVQQSLPVRFYIMRWYECTWKTGCFSFCFPIMEPPEIFYDLLCVSSIV